MIFVKYTVRLSEVALTKGHFTNNNYLSNGFICSDLKIYIEF